MTLNKRHPFDLDVLMRVSMRLVVKRYNIFRMAFLILCDMAVTFFSFVVAIYLYTRIAQIRFYPDMVYEIILIAFAVRVAVFFIFRIYDISFQHASMLYILKTSSVILAVSAIDCALIKLLIAPNWPYVVSVLALTFDLIGSIFFRFTPLMYYEICGRMGEADKNCIIYGCGDTGKDLIPVLAKNRIRIKGFVDDDPRKKGKIINGVKVLGSLKDIDGILGRMKIETLIIAIPTLEGNKVKELRSLCSELNMELKTVPSLYQIYNKSMDQIAGAIRGINYEDLIRRPVRRESFSDLVVTFRSKRIVVTGAGSIGSELVTQLANYDLKEIVVLDNSELSLFNLENSLDVDAAKKVRLRLVDLKNRALIEKVMSESVPDYIFHTAAYKHVPIVEANACEGVLNNLLVLKNVYEAAERVGANKFIFISSDKAVRPTNIMGATKRLGELFLQAMTGRGRMVSASVRFGNVIGSSGSLVPKIVGQIQSNSAVTVTHPEATRFFMLTSEAVMLILKASIMAAGGEIFVLDMGKAIKIVDLVKEIISFYGKVPEIDIPIRYIGLRPGEKLFEELAFDGIESTVYRDGMYVAKANTNELGNYLKAYDDIIAMAARSDRDIMLNLIGKYVSIHTNETLAKERVA